jgi:purine-binding chemotaxis protein CheW
MSAITSTEMNAVARAATPASPDPHALREYLTFRIETEEYGIDILRVQEIRSYEPPTRIAGAPPFVVGVTNLRGVIVPVVDLRLRLQARTALLDGSTVIVVLNVRERVVGVVVDSVSDVIGLDTEQIKAAPQFNERIGSNFITGIASVSGEVGGTDRMLILLDIQALLSGVDIGLVGTA